MKKLMTGNEAAAWAVLLSRVKVLPEYEITPQTPISELLAEFCAKKMMDAIYLPVESEHSALAACVGATLAGKRSFCASSSHGTLLMHEIFHTASGLRLPLVFVNVNRAVGLPWNIWTDQNDSLSQRDTGWIQLYCEDSQETLDTILMAFKIATLVSLPVMVVTEGFILSHTGEMVDLPDQKLVDQFLPPFRPKFKLSLKNPRAFGGLTFPEPYFQMKIDAQRAMERSLSVIKKVDQEFFKIFGRSYGLIEKINWEKNSQLCLVTSGTITSTAKTLKDIPILKIKAFRPFPEKEIKEALKEVKKVLILDRNLSLGREGIFATEIKAALSDKNQVYGFVCGLGGVDVTQQTLREAIDFAKNHPPQNLIFLPKKIEKIDFEKYQSLTIKKKKDLFFAGHSACQGCGLVIGLRMVVEILGQKTMVVFPAGCSTFMGGIFPQTGLALPLTHCNFGAAAAFASGIRAALNDKKEKKIQVLVWAGDGATYDIGFGALSAAAEREEDILYLCANNEAYMNTGIQRSSATPFLAWTTTTPLPQLKLQPKKPLVEIMAAHKIPYSASASIGFYQDLERKLKIAKKIEGFKFIDLLVPCPTGWRARSDLTIKLSRMAVNCGIFPLIEIFDGKKYRINYPQGELLPVKDYLSLQGRFSHLEQSQILEIEKMIKENLDWLKKLQNLNP